MQAHRSIGHLVLRAQHAEPLFDLFTRVFGCPVAWPLQHAEFATYGWAHLGNVDLEIWAARDNGDLPANTRLPIWHGFALEPASPMPDAQAHCASHGIACKPARTFRSPDAQGALAENFTNSVLLDLSSPHCCAFLCEWKRDTPIYPWPGGATPVERRPALQQSLRDRGGGPLGLLGLRTIHLSAPDPAAHQRLWSTLMAGPEQPTALTSDVSLALRPSGHAAMTAITLAVRSLAAARRFLQQEQLLAADRDTSVGVACGGVEVWLVEADQHRT